MKAAIYARKSTDDSDKDAENKSVQRQVQHATAYAVSKGWEVAPEHIFIDDNISGAEYVNRPDFWKMLNSLKRKEFHALVMSESSRLGRDMTRNAYHLTDIIESGVRVFYYLNDTEEKIDTPEAKFMLSAKSYGAEVEREKASQRSRDALRRRAEKGYCTGGTCYGYDTVPVYSTAVSGERVKAHTDFKINEQADVVRRVFSMYVAGHGHTVIGKTMNGDPRYHKYLIKYFDGKLHAPPRKSSSGSWSPSSIYYMLRNERYIGVLTFSRERQVYRGGTKKSERQSEYLKTVREDLQIIPQPLWEAAQKRIKDTAGKYIRSTHGHLQGKPDNGRHSIYLLSCIARCECGGNMIGAYRHIDSRHTKEHYYTCSRYTNRGLKVCSNSLKPKMKELDSLILNTIKTSILDKDNIRYVVEQAMEEVARLQKEEPQKGESLKAELRKTEQELKNFLSLIADGNAPKSVLQEIRAKEAKVEALKAEIIRYHAPVQMNDLDFKRLEKDLTERLVRFEELIFSDISIARQALRKLFKRPLLLKPDGNGGYTVEGETSLGALFAKIVTTQNPSVTQHYFLSF